MRRLDRGDISPTVGYLTAEASWADALEAEDLPDVLRSALREQYADASDAAMAEALDNVLDALSPAEAFNFGSALNQIGKSAGKLAADPTFQQVVRTAAPVAGGALGTFIGGPIGTALGSQLGNLAVRALPTAAAPPAPRAAPPPPPAPSPPTPPPGPPPAAAAPVGPAAVSSAAVAPAPISSASAAVQPIVGRPVPVPAPAPPPAAILAAPGLASSVAGGSAAAAQALVLTQQSDVLRGLLATTLGQYGRPQVGDIPVAQLLALLSRIFAQAASDADALMYLSQEAEVAEGIPEDVSADTITSLYGDLIGADNLELAEAAWDGLG